MPKRGIVAGALMIILALAVPVTARAGNGPMCAGQFGVAGWSATTRVCTFLSDGNQLRVEGMLVAAGTDMLFIFPLPPIVDVAVSIVDGSGATLLSCSALELVLAQCGKTVKAPVAAGTRLSCVTRAWTNLSHGTARTTYACASR
jgi:hypothetical protein